MLRCSVLAQVTSQREYYLADSHGLPLCKRKDEYVVVTDAVGVKKVIPSLDFYVSISGVKYQPKVKLYCVEKTEGRNM